MNRIFAKPFLFITLAAFAVVQLTPLSVVGAESRSRKLKNSRTTLKEYERNIEALNVIDKNIEEDEALIRSYESRIQELESKIDSDDPLEDDRSCSKCKDEALLCNNYCVAKDGIVPTDCLNGGAEAFNIDLKDRRNLCWNIYNKDGCFELLDQNNKSSVVANCSKVRYKDEIKKLRKQIAQVKRMLEGEQKRKASVETKQEACSWCDSAVEYKASIEEQRRFAEEMQEIYAVQASMAAEYGGGGGGFSAYGGFGGGGGNRKPGTWDYILALAPTIASAGVGIMNGYFGYKTAQQTTNQYRIYADNYTKMGIPFLDPYQAGMSYGYGGGAVASPWMYGLAGALGGLAGMGGLGAGGLSVYGGVGGLYGGGMGYPIMVGGGGYSGGYPGGYPGGGMMMPPMYPGGMYPGGGGGIIVGGGGGFPGGGYPGGWPGGGGGIIVGGGGGFPGGGMMPPMYPGGGYPGGWPGGGGGIIVGGGGGFPGGGMMPPMMPGGGWPTVGNFGFPGPWGASGNPYGYGYGQNTMESYQMSMQWMQYQMQIYQQQQAKQQYYSSQMMTVQRQMAELQMRYYELQMGMATGYGWNGGYGAGGSFPYGCVPPTGTVPTGAIGHHTTQPSTGCMPSGGTTPCPPGGPVTGCGTGPYPGGTVPPPGGVPQV